MTCIALKFDHPSDFAAQADAAAMSPTAEAEPARESQFEIFADEIDAWARRALAANGFGDY
jgi:hypothetical protein